MELSEAIQLIQNDHLAQQPQALWADLGCGSGLFTHALAQLLQPGSTIYAVDRILPVLDAATNQVTIHPLQLDFVTQPLPFQGSDGILMANSLHYVADKAALLEQLSAHLKPQANFLIVEYDTDTPVSHWVPYPVSFRSLQQLFANAGYASVQRLGERPSVYGRASLYAAWISR